MDPDGAALLGRDAPEFLGVLGFPSSTECHGVGKYGGAKQTRGQNTLLEISGD
jgi:hypothetical protein